MPAVSVIIPVFNRQKLCERAVASVVQQSFEDFECIIVDDGSEKKLRFPATKSDRRIRLLRNEYRCGVAQARNCGVAAATAGWIAFLDSDDEWLPYKLQRQITWLSHNPGYRILQSREMWIRNGIRVNPPHTHEKKGGNIFAESLERCMITPSSVLLSKEFFNQCGAFNESMPACEDYDLWLRITAHHPVGLIDEILLKRYGGHDDQLSGSVPMLDRFRIRSMLHLLQYEKLTDEQLRLVKKQLCLKAAVLANGYHKRENIAQYEHYSSIAATYGAA